ncbi:MAG: PAS domain S-box protein [bacterium]|nr:PAS domain S-box protein [bacterium]
MIYLSRTAGESKRITFDRRLISIQRSFESSSVNLNGILSAYDVLYKSSEIVTEAEFVSASEILDTAGSVPGFVLVGNALAVDDDTTLPLSTLVADDQTTKKAAGLDLYSISGYRENINKARDTGLVATSSIENNQSIGSDMFSMFVPIYSSGASLSTVSERQDNFAGVVVLAIDPIVYLSSIFDTSSWPNDLAIKIYDGEESASSLIFEYGPVELVEDFDSKLATEIVVGLGDRPWRAQVHGSQYIAGFFVRWVPILVPFIGLLISTSIALLIYYLAKARSKAYARVKETVEDLETSEQKYSDVFEGLPDPIVSLNRLGHIIRVNQAALDASGLSRPELIGKLFTKIGVISPMSIPLTLKNFSVSLRGKMHKPYEVEVKHKNGTKRIYEVNARPIKKNDRVQSVQVVFRDTTEKSQLLKELQKQKDELERVNKFMVGREIKMSELKQTIDKLRQGGAADNG